MRYPTPARWRVRPLHGHDGDTAVVAVDRGGPNRDTSTWSIRLRNVWAPETDEPGGPECAAFVSSWLEAHGDGTDWPYLLETFQTPRSDAISTTFNRIVGEIRDSMGGSLNAAVQSFVETKGYGGGTGAPKN